ncbi:copper ion binding protein [Geomicrobium sp. JCM 19039]|uniref:copper ion binding protein n=1 Tax=Geomicrobium sp. JCM 19039 TaxID=1460636 RepID=UPI00045F3625|nr:copper ion binding protein [Geomicrobium sp. JCM 19039]GAK12837.1 copper(I) chaperone CopZ [Geomicrobium sp. JCM 19039]
MKTIELQVTGMSCGHCVSSIENGVGSKEGVDSVNVDLEKGLVTISFDTSQVQEADLKDTVEDLGYDVA